MSVEKKINTTNDTRNLLVATAVSPEEFDEYAPPLPQTKKNKYLTRGANFEDSHT